MAKTLPRNDELAAQFDLLADILELETSDYFRVQAYRKAASRIRETAGPVAQLALEGRATELADVGKTIQEKIVQVVETGEIEALRKRRATVPADVLSFMRLPGLGPKTARRIWQELGVTTLADLKEAAEAQRLRSLSGLGPKSEEKILAALAKAPTGDGGSRALLGDALPAVRSAVAALEAHPSTMRVSVAGSARRWRETVRDLDLIATASEPEALVRAFTELPFVAEVVARGGTKGTVVSQEGVRFDLRVVPPESFGNLLQHFTGSKRHNVAMREDAVRRGLSISEYGVTVVETGEVRSFESEEELYAFLGYAFVPPELRENAGELEAARAGELPRLVELSDVRGDLHSHTDWSADGKSSLEEMATAARARRYAYYAVTDHSHYLRDGGLARQAEAIDAVNRRLAPFRVLKGVEANIRADGMVDVPEHELAELDWVVASIHQALDRNPTDRLLAAMENPYVDCIGHPTSRKIGRRAPVALELERVVAKAVETGTVLEINGQPDRLDLRDVDARGAVEAGLKLCLDSDAHRVAALGYVELAVGQARRGWLTKEHVVNTRTEKQLARLRKRHR